jgi:hypothetical protein
MSTATAPGSRLVLGLRRLEPEVARVDPPPAPLHFPRSVHLDNLPAECLASWARQVRDAVEPSLVIDAAGRVAALSPSAAVLLCVDPVAALGERLLDLLVLVDFTETGVPLLDPEMHAPPLRALRSGRLTRALVRLRLPLGSLATYDMVGVPLAHGAGAVAFLTEV